MRNSVKLSAAVDSLYARGAATHDSYTNLILQCVRFNDILQARRLQSHMDFHCYQPPNTFLHNRLLHLYAKSGTISDVCNLFDKMPRTDVFSWNALLSAFSKLGDETDVWDVFGRMPTRDSVSYNTVMTCLVGNRSWGKALNVFIEMQTDGFEPTEYSYVSALQACSNTGDLRRGKQVHGKISVAGLAANVFVANRLIDLYAKCGAIGLAIKFFDGMVSRSVVSWNSMIAGCLSNGKPEAAVELFRQMKIAHVQPDLITNSSVIGAYFQCGCVEEAVKLFSDIKEKDRVCWTEMIVGYGHCGREEDALSVFHEMLKEGVSADSFTISSVVSTCSKLASLSLGQVVHGKAVYLGVDNDLLVSSSLIGMYSRCGETKYASRVFESMTTPNVVSWNSMIAGYAQNGQDLEALDLFERMSRENLKPDCITFVLVLSACAHAGLVKDGQGYFNSIWEQHGLTPTVDHYACMINLFGRSGRIDQAVKVINSMDQEPNYLIWSTLLTVCSLNGDVDNAEMAANHLFKLDPLNAGPYIMLSNLYAAHGRWKDVASVRSTMKSKEIKKFAAYSWTEVDNTVHKFVAEDRSHPESEKIYEKLKVLITKLQTSGFTPDANLVLHDVGEDEKFESICYHSEKLALAFALIKKSTAKTPIRIMKNIRVCGDCHVFMKFVSKIIERRIVLRDSTRFHHFSDGICSCKDKW
uniref:DYW domain-containing protein n=1 Tax=Kalanchoe fedtschenkoi TaxID=63787 RepID=A0A7N0VKM3_KALFE